MIGEKVKNNSSKIRGGISQQERKIYCALAKQLGKVQGLTFDHNQIRWITYWKNENGKQVQKHFPVSKYGFNGARRLAIEFRQSKVGNINSKSEAIPDMGNLGYEVDINKLKSLIKNDQIDLDINGCLADSIATALPSENSSCSEGHCSTTHSSKSDKVDKISMPSKNISKGVYPIFKFKDRQKEHLMTRDPSQIFSINSFFDSFNNRKSNTSQKFCQIDNYGANKKGARETEMKNSNKTKAQSESNLIYPDIPYGQIKFIDEAELVSKRHKTIEGSRILDQVAQQMPLVPNIYWHKHKNSWCWRKKLDSGEIISRSYSVGRYGFLKAWKLAIKNKAHHEVESYSPKDYKIHINRKGKNRHTLPDVKTMSSNYKDIEYNKGVFRLLIYDLVSNISTLGVNQLRLKSKNNDDKDSKSLLKAFDPLINSISCLDDLKSLMDIFKVCLDKKLMPRKLKSITKEKVFQKLIKESQLYNH